MSDDELIYYFYEELIMTLITLSLPAIEQKEMVGQIGCVGDEILEDYDNFYRSRRQIYIDNNIFKETELNILDGFDKYLDKFNGHNEDFYWSIEELKNNPLWAELRTEAKNVLSKVFGENYHIEVQRKYERIGGKLMETTKRKLVKG